MAMKVTVVISPTDKEAQDWYERYRGYCAFERGPAARLYAWRYEPDVWFMAGMTPLLICGFNASLEWWVMLPISLAVGSYWAIAADRKPRVRRKYERLMRKRRILSVPTFLVNTTDAEARRLGIYDWGQYPVRRFAILRDTLLEAAPWLTELRNDCGCQEDCGHTNRLDSSNRANLRHRIQAVARRKVRQAAQDHAAAIEMNKHRQRHIKGALDVTPEEDD